MAVNYTLTLTDDSDLNPETLPFTSFQTTWRDYDATEQRGDSYLEVVIPGLDYVDLVAARPLGIVRVYRNGSELFASPFEAIRTDAGPVSQSMSLRCRTQWTNPAPAARTMTNEYLLSVDNNRQTWRGASDGVTMPGDTVTVHGGTSFVVESLTYITGGGQDDMILVAVPPGV